MITEEMKKHKLGRVKELLETMQKELHCPDVRILVKDIETMLVDGSYENGHIVTALVASLIRHLATVDPMNGGDVVLSATISGIMVGVQNAWEDKYLESVMTGPVQ